jgi:adenosylmethionine-8-amino-7-oxononanoate aminotransferase
MKDHEILPPIPIAKGEGVWLEDFEGNRYLDAISSWWVNLFGHANPDINRAITQQLNTLEQVIFAGFTHEPAVLLGERLLSLAPQGLSRIFYADNGSSAIEIALKMSFHYWLNTGQPQKTKFITLANSYHGETLGALSVGDVALYKKTYHPLLMTPIVVPSPDCYYREAGESWEAYTTHQFEHLYKALEQHSDTVCAVIVEPLVQCAGLMRMYHPCYLSLLKKACDLFGVHLIVDEVAVGFGRTGTLFACEQASITPDFLCLGKGLTGGYLPLSAVLTTAAVYEAFYDDYATQKAFLHSHSYTGNPLACRAALATLDIFEKNPVLERNHHLALCMRKASEVLKEHPHVGEIRHTGMITAIELVQDKQTKHPFPWQARIGFHVYRSALQQGVLLRPLGSVVYFMPPYVITETEIQTMVAVARRCIAEATA